MKFSTFLLCQCGRERQQLSCHVRNGIALVERRARLSDRDGWQSFRIAVECTLLGLPRLTASVRCCGSSTALTSRRSD